MLKSRRLARFSRNELPWERAGTAALGVLMLTFAAFVVRTAWMSDDAYTTLMLPGVEVR